MVAPTLALADNFTYTQHVANASQVSGVNSDTEGLFCENITDYDGTLLMGYVKLNSDGTINALNYATPATGLGRVNISNLQQVSPGRQVAGWVNTSTGHAGLFFMDVDSVAGALTPSTIVTFPVPDSYAPGGVSQPFLRTDGTLVTVVQETWSQTSYPFLTLHRTRYQQYSTAGVQLATTANANVYSGGAVLAGDSLMLMNTSGTVAVLNPDLSLTTLTTGIAATRGMSATANADLIIGYDFYNIGRINRSDGSYTQTVNFPDGGLSFRQQVIPDSKILVFEDITLESSTPTPTTGATAVALDPTGKALSGWPLTVTVPFQSFSTVIAVGSYFMIVGASNVAILSATAPATATVVPPLRLGQRNDGLGPFASPRLRTSVNTGTSVQSPGSIRVGSSINRYR